jgi:hypothetical protein
MLAGGRIAEVNGDRSFLTLGFGLGLEGIELENFRRSLPFRFQVAVTRRSIQ